MFIFKESYENISVTVKIQDYHNDSFVIFREFELRIGARRKDFSKT